MKRIISIIIISIAVLVVVFFGYIIVKYATLEPIKAIEALIFLGLFGFAGLVIWAVDNLMNLRKH